MSKKAVPLKEESPTNLIDRRQALFGFGAFAVGAPVLAASCAPGATGGPGGSGGHVGTGGVGTGGAGTGGAGTGGAGTGGAGTGGAGTGGAGTGGAGTGGAGTGGAGTGGAGTGGAGTGGAGTGGAGTGGAGTGGAGTGGAGVGGAAAGGAAAGGAGGGISMPSSPMFDNVANCTLTPTDGAGEGPFFIHEDEVMNDPTLFRRDMRDGHGDGVEFQVNLRVLDSSQMCAKPVADVEVYIWHCDALGWYSGFANQDPNRPTMGSLERTVENGDRFCRGAQLTNADGIVSFTSVFPGWYTGRALHVHFLALKKGSGAQTTSYRGAPYHVFTTQFYFDETFGRMIHENYAPYMSRASGTNYNACLKPESTVRPTMKMNGNVAVATMNILTNPSQKPQVDRIDRRPAATRRRSRDRHRTAGS